MRIGHVVLTGLFAIALGGRASANGRDPYTSTINFRPGMESHIIAGMTFGALRSDDGGATWQWYCEKDIGYGGTYDPDYAYSSSGAVFATTFDGLKVMHDGCTFTATSPGMTFISRVERAPNGDLYIAASDPNDTQIYKSSWPNDGQLFGSAVTPPGGMPNDWWDSIMIAPSNAMHVYLTGYRLPPKCVAGSKAGMPCVTSNDCPGSTCEAKKEFLLFSSTDAGASYTAMSMTGISPTSMNSTIDVVGIDPTHENIVYARVSLENPTSGDSIYKSVNGGTSWTKILTKASNIGGLSFLVRADGTCIAGTRDIGSWTTPAVGATGCAADSTTAWTTMTGAPHIGCLYRNPANDEVWACTQNVASPQLNLTSDGYGIMKSSNLTTWTGVLRFQDIQKPVSCGAGSVQEDQCVQRYLDPVLGLQQSPWCCLTSQLGIDSTAVDCNSPDLQCYGPSPEPAMDGGTMVKKPPPGCLGCGASGGPSFGLTFLVGGLLLRRRRRCR